MKSEYQKLQPVNQHNLKSAWLEFYNLDSRGWAAIAGSFSHRPFCARLVSLQRRANRQQDQLLPWLLCVQGPHLCLACLPLGANWWTAKALPWPRCLLGAANAQSQGV